MKLNGECDDKLKIMCDSLNQASVDFAFNIQ